MLVLLEIGRGHKSCAELERTLGKDADVAAVLTVRPLLSRRRLHVAASPPHRLTASPPHRRVSCVSASLWRTTARIGRTWRSHRMARACVHPPQQAQARRRERRRASQARGGRGAAQREGAGDDPRQRGEGRGRPVPQGEQSPHARRADRTGHAAPRTLLRPARAGRGAGDRQPRRQGCVPAATAAHSRSRHRALSRLTLCRCSFPLLPLPFSLATTIPPSSSLLPSTTTTTATTIIITTTHISNGNGVPCRAFLSLSFLCRPPPQTQSNRTHARTCARAGTPQSSSSGTRQTRPSFATSRERRRASSFAREPMGTTGHAREDTGAANKHLIFTTAKARAPADHVRPVGEALAQSRPDTRAITGGHEHLWRGTWGDVTG